MTRETSQVGNRGNRSAGGDQVAGRPFQLEAQRVLLQRLAGEPLKQSMNLKGRLTGPFGDGLKGYTIIQKAVDVAYLSQELAALLHGLIIADADRADLMFLATA